MRTYFAVRLNNLYIRQPYHYHITNNSSKIINHLTQEINLITVGCNNLLIFITELAVILGLIFFCNLPTIYNANFIDCNVTINIHF